MTVGVQSALNTPPPAAPLRTLATPWGTAGALRALLRAWAGAPCSPQGPHVQLAGGRGCHHPGVGGKAGRQQGGDEQDDRDGRADHRQPQHSHSARPLLAPTLHLRLHDPAPGRTGKLTCRRSRERRPWWRRKEHWQPQQQRPGREDARTRTGPAGRENGWTDVGLMSSKNGLRAKSCLNEAGEKGHIKHGYQQEQGATGGKKGVSRNRMSGQAQMRQKAL